MRTGKLYKSKQMNYFNGAIESIIPMILLIGFTIIFYPIDLICRKLDNYFLNKVK